MRTRNQILLSLGIAIMTALPMCGRDNNATGKEPGKESTTYTDPKGFFSISPPSGWRAEEYPQDRRGKVAFRAPDDETTLRVLAMAIGTSDYQVLIHHLKETEKQLGVQTNIEPTMFKRMPAIKTTATITIQGLPRKYLWVNLLIDGVQHNVEYSSPPNLFDRHYEIAWKSMLTYEPIRREKPASPEEARKDVAAKWLRLAQIALEMGKPQAAKDAVAVGLEADPKNAELFKLKRDLDKR